jgi:hypothetical protein
MLLTGLLLEVSRTSVRMVMLPDSLRLGSLLREWYRLASCLSPLVHP